MIITGIFHAAIKTNDLKATVDFYTKVLGLREAPRPDFGYPGAWLACPTASGDATWPAARSSSRRPAHRRRRRPDSSPRRLLRGSGTEWAIALDLGSGRPRARFGGRC